MKAFTGVPTLRVALALALLAATGLATTSLVTWSQRLEGKLSDGLLTEKRDGVVVRIEAPGGMTWTGRVKQADGTFQEVPAATASELRKRLAEIQVLIDVDRSLAGALKELEELRLRASRVGYAERIPVLIEIALSLAETLDALGRREEAISAVWPPLLPQRVDPNTTFEVVGATKEDRAALAKAAEDPRLLALRAKWKQAGGAAEGERTIENIVAEAFAAKQFNPLKDLGDRALPALEQGIANDLGALPSWSEDPLRTLIEINCGRAGTFARARLDEGGPVWKARVIRALKTSAITGASMIYGQYEQGHPTIRFPEWMGVVERLLDDPATRGETLELVRILVRMDLLSTGQQQRLVTFLNGADATLAAMATAAVQEGDGRSTTFPIYEAALRSPHADVRRLGATKLVQYEDPGALLASFESPDPEVRRAVAIALRRRNVAEPNYSAGNFAPRSFTPQITAAQRAVLERLLADSDTPVRAEAATSILQLPSAVSEATYARIANDPEVRVRAPLLFNESVPLAIRAQCALSLASESDPGVLAELDRFVFWVLAPERDEPWSIDPAFLPALRARHANTVLPFGAENGRIFRLAERMSRTGAGLSELLRWCLHSKGDAALAATAAEGLSRLLGKDLPVAYGKRPPQGTSAAAAGLDVTPAEFTEFFLGAWNQGADDWRLVSALSRLSRELGPSFLSLARDPKRELPVRLAALDVGADGPVDQVTACLLDLLADPGWKTVLPGYHLARMRVAWIAEALRGEPADRALATLISDQRVAPGLAAAYVEGYARSRPLDAATADKVLAIWYDDRNVAAEALMPALKQVATRPRAEQRDWLVRAARDTRFWRWTLDLMGELKEPSYLPVLAKCLEDGYPPEFGHGDPGGARDLPLNALTRYFDDAAAAVILAAASKTADPKLREQCFAALETIRKYQDEKGRWDDSRVSREAIAVAVRDLLVLLDDPNAAVRAQAVKGLGTLRAIEQMPRIVRMLKDADASVRNAATETLEVLNRPPAKQD